MRFLITLGFLVGFCAVLAAAVLTPFDAQERVTSRTSVANNGGRLETFIIRLPADRIVTARGAAAGDAGFGDGTVALPAPLASAPLTLEQFKMRNVDGDVIGIATRQWTAVDIEGNGQAVGDHVWLASIPGRGTLAWTSAGSASTSLSAALNAAGSAQGDVQYAAPIATVTAGTEEFAATEGSVEALWTVTGIDAEGQLRGTITLNTTVNQKS